MKARSPMHNADDNQEHGYAKGEEFADAIFGLSELDGRHLEERRD